MNRQDEAGKARRARVADLLETFDAKDAPPVEASSVDGLVTISLDARYRVQGVSVRGLDLASADAARLEAALSTALDEAVREVSARNMSRLIQGLFSRQDAGKGDSADEGPRSAQDGRQTP